MYRACGITLVGANTVQCTLLSPVCRASGTAAAARRSRAAHGRRDRASATTATNFQCTPECRPARGVQGGEVVGGVHRDVGRVMFAAELGEQDVAQVPPGGTHPQGGVGRGTPTPLRTYRGRHRS
ncbi:hypothetical protein DBP15_00800 [Streptomyces sp. CS065A]|nr:hypothetical protein DBP15_00800 [Streptomyces sp. CS065A]